ncbi:MAG TPA: hypothetical protein PL131_06565 [Methylotenera sp.]|nr:hypothetical protein [Methylotenera sp.]HPH05521.1 hypothetical protein [Methylotenera sp.]HPN00065.1 hypothetical protein [Methylotenera sp.]
MHPSPEKNNQADDLVPRSKNVLISYWLLFIVALTTTVGLQFAAPSFEALFSSLGADIPWLTLAVMDYRKLLLTLPLYMGAIAITLLIFKRVKSDFNKAIKIVFLLDLCTFITIACMVAYALYLPIFKMGKVA